MFIDADKQSIPRYLEQAARRSRARGRSSSSTTWSAAVAVVDADHPDDRVQGVRAMVELLTDHPRYDATVRPDGRHARATTASRSCASATDAGARRRPPHRLRGAFAVRLRASAAAAGAQRGERLVEDRGAVLVGLRRSFT